MSGGRTPGPWEIRVNGVFLRVVHGEHKTIVADSIVSETNARLIAAAPDMLEALERLILAGDTRALRGRDHVPSMRDEQDARQAARAAIAKATGQ